MRWVLFIPAAVLAGIAGSLLGGIVASLFGQPAADTGSAFAGSFAFIFTAGFVAPAARHKVGFAVALLVGLLAIGTFILSTFTTIDEFSRLPERAKILTPVAQVVAALYAVFILPPFVVAGSTLERLWREFISLGIVVSLFGIALGLVGGVAAATGHGWFVLKFGGGVLLLGLLTWMFPFAHMMFRMPKAPR